MNVLCITLIAGVVLAPLVTRLVRRGIDPFEPIVVFAVAWMVMFVVRPLAELSRGEPLYVRPTLIIHLHETFTLALGLALLGGLGFVLGYERDVGRRLAARLPMPARRFSARRTLSGLLLVGAAAAVGFALFLGHAGALSRSGLEQLLGGRSFELTEAQKGATYLWQLSLAFVPAAVGLVALAAERRTLALWSLVLMLCVLVLLRALPVGSRMMLLPFVGGLVVYRYLLRGRRPGVLPLAVVALLGLLASSLLLQTRGGQRTAAVSMPEAVATLLAHPALVLEPVTQGADTEMVTALAAALQVVPSEVPFHYGLGLLGDLLVRPIPRSLWPAKPLPPREKVIAALWPAEYATHVANPEFSVLLPFYLDFGILGVAVGMGLYGLLARIAYEYLRRFPTRTAVRLLYALGLPFLVIALRDSPVDVVNRLAFMWLPLFLVLRAARLPQVHGEGRVAAPLGRSAGVHA